MQQGLWTTTRSARLLSAAGLCAALAGCGKLEIGSRLASGAPDAGVGSEGNGAGFAAGSGGAGAQAGSAQAGSAGAGSAGAGSAGAGSAGAGPLDDVRQRAAVDAFFDHPEAARFVLPSGTLAETPWLYTFDAPPHDWMDASFDGAGFSRGAVGFYFGTSMPEDEARTPWAEGAAELWARATFSLGSPEELSELVFWGRWDDTADIYVNGVLAASKVGWSQGYRYIGIRDEARAALRIGENIIAVHVVDAGGAKYFDLGLVRDRRLVTRPRTGFERTPALGVYTDTVERFMVERGIPAGVLAVMKRDAIVVSRGLGWSDKAMTRPIAEDAVLRVGMFDGLVTRAAIRAIIDASPSLTEDTPVFPLLAQRGLTPAPGFPPNDLVVDVTFRHLMLNEDGLRSLPHPQQFYRDLETSAEHVTAEHVMRWIYGAGPETVPGECPSPGGCGPVSDTVLRYFVHVHEGDLLEHLRQVVLAPMGTADVFPAHERLAGRSPREPGYFTLESPHDRWLYLENQLRLSATAPALVRFSRGYHVVYFNRLEDAVTGAWAPIPDNGTNVVVGGQEGTFDLLLQRLSDEVSVAVIFNITGDYGVLADELDVLTNGIAESDWGL